MTNSKSIHSIGKNIVQKWFEIKPVTLLHPLPVRPLRTLGLLQMNGEIYSSEKLSRIIYLKTNIAFASSIYSIFITPRVAYNLPVFACEFIFKGRERIVLADIKHRTAQAYSLEDEISSRLIEMQQPFKKMFAKKPAIREELKQTFSKAACLMKIAATQEQQALDLISQYLEVFCEMVDQAVSVTDDKLKQVQDEYNAYCRYALDHDPAVNFLKKIFGKQTGIARAQDLFLSEHI